jgi:hypothetical protein
VVSVTTKDTVMYYYARYTVIWIQWEPHTNLIAKDRRRALQEALNTHPAMMVSTEGRGRRDWPLTSFRLSGFIFSLTSHMLLGTSLSFFWNPHSLSYSVKVKEDKNFTVYGH